MAQERHSFIGSWRLNLFPAAGTEPHLSFVSFMASGILMTSPPPVERFPPTPGGIVYVSTGHGMWESTGEQSLALTFSAQAVNGEGALVGVGTVSAGLELGSDGQGFSGSYAFEMADPGGAIFATEEGKVQATRIVVNVAAASTTNA